VALAALILALLPELILFGACIAPNPKVEAKAAIIDHLYDLQPDEAFIVQITQYLEGYDFKVDLYRKLPTHEYQLIIFRVHLS
jgi:hypothetical protein